MTDIAGSLISSLLSQRFDQNRLDQERQQQLQDAERRHELNVLTQAVGSGQVGSKDLANLAAGFQYVTPADLQGLGAWADLNRKIARERDALAPGGPENLGALTAIQPGARPGQTQPASDTANATAGEGLAQLIGSLNGMSQEDQANYVPQLMNRFAAGREATTQKNLANVANEQRAGLQSQANTRVEQAGANQIAQDTAITKGLAEHAAYVNDQEGKPPSLQDMMQQAQQYLPGAPPARVVAIAQGALANLPGADAAFQKWKRGGLAKGVDETRVDNAIALDQESYPNLTVDEKYRNWVRGEISGIAVRDPVPVDPAKPSFFRVSNPKEAQQKLDERNALVDTIAQQDRLNTDYAGAVQAQKEGRLGGGPFQTDRLYDGLTVAGIQAPEVAQYRADLINYTIALLKSMRLGRLTNQEIAYQLLTFPTLAEIGQQNGDVKMAARNDYIQDQIRKPYAPSQIEKLKLSVPANIRAKLSGISDSDLELDANGNPSKAVQAIINDAGDFAAGKTPPSLGSRAAPTANSPVGKYFP